MFTSFLTKLSFYALVVLLFTIPANFRKISLASMCPCEDKEQCDRIKTVDHLKQYDKEVCTLYFFFIVYLYFISPTHIVKKISSN